MSASRNVFATHDQRLQLAAFVKGLLDGVVNDVANAPDVVVHDGELSQRLEDVGG